MLMQVVTITLNPAVDWTVAVPALAIGEVNRVVDNRTSAGGKGVNVASLLADYGLHVGATGFLGRANASIFEELFVQKGIEDAFVRISGATRTSIKVVDRLSGVTTDVNFSGLSPSEAEVQAVHDGVMSIAERAKPWIVLAGSLPPGVDTDLVGRLVRRLKMAGCPVVVDTSGEALSEAVGAAPDIIKPNLRELEVLAGRSLRGLQAVREAAREVVEGGVPLVAVSMGADGALFVTDDEVVMARSPDVEVGSTAGAGDAMVAGIVSGRIDGRSLDYIARLSTAFSLHVLTRDRLTASLSTAIEYWLPQVRTERL
ncbi:MAG: 1-phosphofructokinase [Bacteroidota bacterium]